MKQGTYEYNCVCYHILKSETHPDQRLFEDMKTKALGPTLPSEKMNLSPFKDDF